MAVKFFVDLYFLNFLLSHIWSRVFRITNQEMISSIQSTIFLRELGVEYVHPVKWADLHTLLVENERIWLRINIRA